MTRSKRRKPRLTHLPAVDTRPAHESIGRSRRGTSECWLSARESAAAAASLLLASLLTNQHVLKESVQCVPNSHKKGRSARRKFAVLGELDKKT